MRLCYPSAHSHFESARAIDEIEQSIGLDAKLVEKPMRPSCAKAMTWALGQLFRNEMALSRIKALGDTLERYEIE